MKLVHVEVERNTSIVAEDKFKIVALEGAILWKIFI